MQLILFLFLFRIVKDHYYYRVSLTGDVKEFCVGGPNRDVVVSFKAVNLFEEEYFLIIINILVGLYLVGRCFVNMFEFTSCTEFTSPCLKESTDCHFPIFVFTWIVTRK